MPGPLYVHVQQLPHINYSMVSDLTLMMDALGFSWSAMVGRIERAKASPLAEVALILEVWAAGSGRSTRVRFPPFFLVLEPSCCLRGAMKTAMTAPHKKQPRHCGIGNLHGAVRQPMLEN